MNLFDQATTGFKAGDMLDGQTAFTLYDTYGFPLDLTQDEARRRGFSVNVDGFESAMAEQRDRSREHWKGSGQTASAGAWLSLRDQHGGTEFTGYESETGEGKVIAIVKDGAETASAATGETVEVLLDKTPFYGEGGGQAGDKGAFVWSGGEGRVLDTKKHGGDLHVHTLEVTKGALAAGAVVTATVEEGSRPTTRANHSAAHLFHAAVKNVLGAHVAQKGQMVDAERMRFDFSYNAPMTDEEIARVEPAHLRRHAPVVVDHARMRDQLVGGADDGDQLAAACAEAAQVGVVRVDVGELRLQCAAARHDIRELRIAQVLPAARAVAGRVREGGAGPAGSCRKRAVMSEAMKKGACPATRLRLAPRGSPHQSWFGDSVVPRPLSMAGSGTEPSAVGPYHILFTAVACTVVRQSAVALLPPSLVHSRALSLAGS